jgi:pimeloyl-ACP methyl ester carboxylesterase
MTFIIRQKIVNDTYQSELDPFYNLPQMSEDYLPGQIIRSQKISTRLKSGTAYRILYVSQYISAGKSFSSGIIFVPNTPNTEKRKIVAWAHGTIGMGDSCAPSRNPNFMDNLPWVDQMMRQNYVVTATDYSGLGTAGTERYLLGSDQALDILNSIKAVTNFAPANAANEYVLWGHSQGGQATLFAAHLSPKFLPNHKLVAVAVAAPTAELVSLVSLQHQGVIPWVIASEIALAWPQQYANLDLKKSLTPSAFANYSQIAQLCLANGTLEATVLTDIGQQFFSQDPTQNPTWRQALTDQTPKPLSPRIPTLIIQSLSDQVVLPSTTALFISKSCLNNSNIQTIWLNDVAHQNTAIVAGPTVTNWFQDRFAGIQNTNSCREKLPILPSED